MQRIAVVDTGLCNVDSIVRALEECGAKADVTDRPQDLDLADKIVLPGVGAFPDAMKSLESKGLADTIRANVIDHGVPILGVCLGMQLLATESSEVAPTLGLDLIPGRVVRLVPRVPTPTNPNNPNNVHCTRSCHGDSSAFNGREIDERVPHVGWNEVVPAKPHPLFAGIPSNADFYFVHSFHVQCSDATHVLATTPYCGLIASVIASDHIMGTQFHPEKSQSYGLTLLRNFVGM